MSFVSIEFVKNYFPLWNKFCLDENSEPQESILRNEMNLADQRLLEFVNVTPETITEPLKLHLLNIIKKRCFDRQHGDTEFEMKPSIIRDYEDTVSTLQAIKEGKLNLSAAEVSSQNSIKLVSKPRRFGEWFNE